MDGAARGALALALVAVLSATVAQADVIGGANVRASFDGWLTPRALPRAEPAPVALHLKGRLRTTDGKLPPQLRKVTIEINRFGEVSTVGLPVCRREWILASTTAQALSRCRDALVGSGRFDAHILIPSQSPFPANGQMLAFNSRMNGRRVVLAHIFGTDPLPTSQVLTLKFQAPVGRKYGTTMSVEMPKVAADWGHVSGFQLTLHRRYAYKGRTRSVISASCPAPRGFREALFSAARGTYLLADGRRITRVITGSCRVRH